jgi:hydrogenase expression/formation protein HypE
MAIMSAREGFAFETALESDCASLVASVMDLLASGIAVRCLRDLTRGGLATALVEISEGAKREFRVDEALVPVIGPVRAACEMLGLDPLYVANEGRFVAFVAANDAERALHVLHRHEVSRGACRIGVVGDASSRGLVTARGSIGTRRILDRLSGEQLPRIC